MYMNLCDKLKNAFDYSTRNDNKFQRAIKRVAWDEEFYADGEFYFIKYYPNLGKGKKVIFTTPSLDPFNMEWRPDFMIISDGDFYSVTF